MAPIPGGVRVTGFVSPSDSADNYATHKDIYGSGGFMTVANAAARLAIPAERRVIGMSVRQQDTMEVWTLQGGIADVNWILDPMWVTDALRKLLNTGNVYFVEASAGVDAVARGTYSLPLKTIQYCHDNYVTAGNNDVILCWDITDTGFDENTNVDGLRITKNGTIIIGLQSIAIDNSNVGATSTVHINANYCKFLGFWILPEPIGIVVDGDDNYVGSEEYQIWSNAGTPALKLSSGGTTRVAYFQTENSNPAIEINCSQNTVKHCTLVGTAGGGDIGINFNHASADENSVTENTISQFVTGVNFINGAEDNVVCNNDIVGCTTPIAQANFANTNKLSGNRITPAKTTSAYTYNAGVAEETAFTYTNADNNLKRFVGSLDFTANITAAKIMTVRVKEEVDGATLRIIDSQTYTVGTDPNPHIDFVSFRDVTVTIQINLTEGVNRDVPRSIAVKDME